MGDGEREMDVLSYPFFFPSSQPPSDTVLSGLSHDFLVRFRSAACRFPLRLKPESTHWGMKTGLFSRTVNEGTTCCTINPTSPLENNIAQLTSLKIGRYLKSSSKCSHQNIGPILR